MQQKYRITDYASPIFSFWIFLAFIIQRQSLELDDWEVAEREHAHSDTFLT